MSRRTTGKRKGSAGHRDRKPITQQSISLPIVKGARSVHKYLGEKALGVHLALLPPWQRRRMGLDPSPTAQEQDLVASAVRA